MKVLNKSKKIDVDSNRNQFEFRTMNINNYRAISSWDDPHDKYQDQE